MDAPVNMTLQDMRDTLKGQYRADEAIFWFGLFWNSGSDTDLYRIMCETKYDPHFYALRKKFGSNDEYLTPASDPEIVYCHTLLCAQWERGHGRLIEYPLRPIKFGTLKENDVVVHGPGRPFICIPAGWPCRVYRVGGELKVPCAEDKTGRAFHPLKAGRDGYLIGFRR
jgi:hypothetical protein